MSLNGYIKLYITQWVEQINFTIYDVYILTISTFFGEYLGAIDLNRDGSTRMNSKTFNL